MEKKKKMSFVEKAGLFFGIVGVLADFTALVSFTYGFSSLDQFTPGNISSDSAASFFKWFSGLIIIYAWFISSWYLTRRTFVYRYEKPKGYKNPLSSRSIRTIFGIGLFLVPTFIYWSIVNTTISVSFVKDNSTNISETQIVTTNIVSQSNNQQILSTPSLDINATAMATSDFETATALAEQPFITISATSTPITVSTMTPEQVETSARFFFGSMYYLFVFPFILFFFGLVIYASINSLMPIVHVELLDDYE